MFIETHNPVSISVITRGGAGGPRPFSSQRLWSYIILDGWSEECLYIILRIIELIKGIVEIVLCLLFESIREHDKIIQHSRCWAIRAYV